MPEGSAFAELAAQLQPELKDRLSKIEEEQKKSFTESEQRHEKEIEAQKEVGKETSEAFKNLSEYFANPPAFKPEPEAPKYQNYFNPTVMQSLFTVASLFTMMSSFKGAEYGSNAIDFLSGAIDGYLGGSRERAFFGLRQYQNELGKAIRENQKILDDWNAIGQSKKLTLEGKLEKGRLLAVERQIGSEQMRNRLDNINSMIQFYNALSQQQQNALNWHYQLRNLDALERHYKAMEAKTGGEKQWEYIAKLSIRASGGETGDPAIDQMSPEQAHAIRAEIKLPGQGAIGKAPTSTPYVAKVDARAQELLEQGYSQEDANEKLKAEYGYKIIAASKSGFFGGWVVKTAPMQVGTPQKPGEKGASKDPKMSEAVERFLSQFEEY